MTISNELLDELLKGCKRPEDLLGDAGLMKELKIRLMERMLGAELTAHLGYEEGKEAPPGQANRRNGSSTKVLKGQDGELPVAVPRDRDSSFEPELVKKGQTRIDGVDDKIIGLYAAGLTVRDIQAHLLDLYGLKVSPDLISRVTDAVLDEVREWQGRALDRMYPIVIFDALRTGDIDVYVDYSGTIWANQMKRSDVKPRAEVLAEKFRLFPAGCFVLETSDGIAGYCFSHPWVRGAVPALDSLLGSMPVTPTTYYVHDLTLDASLRGQGQGRAIVPLLFEAAQSLGLSHLSLVAVNRRGPFWQAAGFSCSADEALQAAARAKYDSDAVHMERQL